jgi:PAS domain S-box-containing protein
MKKIKFNIALKIIFLVSSVALLFLLLSHFMGLRKLPIFLEVIVEVCLLIILLLIFTPFMYQPIKKLLEAIKKVEKGEFDIDLDIRTHDEIGVIAYNFKRMVEALKKNREELEEQGKFSKLVMEIIDEAIMLIDDNFRIIWTNKKCKELVKLTEEELIGAFCYKITHHLDEPCKGPHDICPIKEVLKTSSPITVTHTHFDKDGNEFFVEISVYPLRDEEGKITKFLHVARDVTEKMRLLKKISEQNKKLEEYSKELEKEVEERTKDLAAGMREAEKQRLAMINMLEDIEAAHRELAKVNEQLKNTQAQLVQSAKMAAVGELASGVAHEINNPLTAILNNVQLIKLIEKEKGSISSEEIKEITKMIEDAALRCKSITTTLLDFSHLSKGEFKPVSINEIVEKVLTLIEYEMKVESIFVQKEFSENLPLVNGDSQLLQQVILNIIANARWAIKKKSERKGGTITIKTYYNEDQNTVFVAISDTGIGISKENLERIFDAFFTTKEVGEGTGLGLSICYNIIKHHKGRIEVESKVGEGTTFSIILPAIKE